MSRTRPRESREAPCDIIDFDDALFDACPPDERKELLTEARIVAHAFAGTGAAAELEEMAETLSTGGRDQEMGRAHARKLAAALKRLASDPWSCS